MNICRWDCDQHGCRGWSGDSQAHWRKHRSCYCRNAHKCKFINCLMLLVLSKGKNQYEIRLWCLASRAIGNFSQWHDQTYSVWFFRCFCKFILFYYCDFADSLSLFLSPFLRWYNFMPECEQIFEMLWRQYASGIGKIYARGLNTCAPSGGIPFMWFDPL